MKIVDYGVISNKSLDGLEDHVKCLLAKGWQLWGNLIAYPVIPGFYQAMVKYQETDEETDERTTHTGPSDHFLDAAGYLK